MLLLGPLAAGIRGAALGTAEIYERGTSTRADYYTEFDGTGAVTSGASVALDANGGAEIYVGEFVDVVVRDADATIVRNFTAGGVAKTTDYTGPSFTGVNYVTAAAGVNQPVSVQDALDRWEDSAGAPDFQVLYGGVATDLTTVAAALNSLNGIIVSVKAYGAVGDGITNDVSSINTAIAAVVALGGGNLVFPPGTYLINTALTVTDKVSFTGAGAGSTTIVQQTAALSVLTIAGSTEPNIITGLTLRHSSAAGAGVSEVAVPNATKVRFRDCIFGSTSRFTQYGITLATAGTATECAVDACTFIASIYGIRDQRVTAPSSVLMVDGCKFQANTTGSSAGVASPYCVVNKCFFDNSAQTSGTSSGVDFNADTGPASSAFCVVTGCSFSNPTSGTAQGIDIPAVIPATTTFFEDQNTFGGSVSAIYGGMDITFASKGAWIKLGSRESRVADTTNNSSHTARTDLSGTVLVRRTTNANSTITTTMVPEGTRGRLIVWNQSAGTIAAQTVAGPAGTADFITGGAGVSLTAGQMRLWEFVGIHGTAARHTLAIADAVNCGTPT